MPPASLVVASINRAWRSGVNSCSNSSRMALATHQCRHRDKMARVSHSEEERQDNKCRQMLKGLIGEFWPQTDRRQRRKADQGKGEPGGNSKIPMGHQNLIA